MKNENKRDYTEPEMELVAFEESDVITVSINDPNDDSGWSSGWI